MKIMGGGDAKLIAAVGLWAGPALALQTLLLMALAGGVMALGMIVYSALRMRLSFVGMVAPGTAIKSQPLPYGLAIAAAGLWMLHSLASA
jgi:prepilin peptidase CpaA